MNVLCVVAHPDDEVIGVGGTLASHAKRGDDVHVVILSDGVTSRHDSITEEVQAEIDERRGRAKEACEILGASVSFHTFPDQRFDTVPLIDLTQTVEAEVDAHEPSIVYTHHHGDLNLDHELTSRAVMTAGRPQVGTPIRRVYGFETLSSTEWATPEPSNAFQPTSFKDISESLETKESAMQVYQRELRDPPHPRSEKSIRQNAEVWGAKVGFDAAEPFVLLREVRD
ncbi:PIG-L deacetylase family protein [Haloferax profundi]|uniref:GlcNAc-PI de-N-acetylase n=1 Tax=Haloferax profundi TaxID=1544718 RepID=A0A0W1SWV4_9EURY|nr:PIG-L family deacetylase [Haloferax profundi]KTG30934.1 hypothetical protein AUR66_05545 [Haloferax profundi]